MLGFIKQFIKSQKTPFKTTVFCKNIKLNMNWKNYPPPPGSIIILYSVYSFSEFLACWEYCCVSVLPSELFTKVNNSIAATINIYNFFTFFSPSLDNYIIFFSVYSLYTDSTNFTYKKSLLALNISIDFLIKCISFLAIPR
jgi:hypothetical protein